jgi:DNA-directed RNA polymerase subunit RPC12/RpoP
MQRVFTTDKGAIVEVPYIPIDKVIETQGRSTKWDIPPNVRSSIYEKYLATLNCFVVNFEAGSAFVEVQDPMRDIGGFIQSKNRQYFCGNCKQEITANDDTDHTGEKCSRCGSNATKRINPADFEANMKRIKSLVDYVKEIS